MIENRFVPNRTLLLLAFLLASLGWTQDRFESGELKGFTIGRGEHIINHLDDAITVREVKGKALIADGSESPADGVLFELKGPEESGPIIATTTKRDGKFRLKHIRAGKYLFKATMTGFQSVVGTIIVSPKADATHVVSIEMKLGV